MYTRGSDTRSLVGVTIAIVIAFVLIVLNLAIQFSEGLYRTLTAYAHFPLAGGLINFLFLWLALLLWLALRRWRRVAQVNKDLEAIVSSISPDAMIVVDPDRTVRMCNDSVAQIFGRSPHEVVGCKTDLLYRDRRIDPTRPREIYEALQSKGFHYGEATGLRKDGSTLPLEIITGELVGKRGAVLLVRDITERAALEAQRRRLEERAMQNQKLESLGVLAGGVAHDFNNLLMIIQGHADLIIMRAPKEDGIAESVTEILRSTHRARELCRHLLSFAGRAPREVRSCSLSSAARDAVKLLNVRVPAHVTVKTELPEPLRAVSGDPSQLNQIVMNLLTNAFDAIGQEPGTVTVTTGERDCDAEFLAETMGGDPVLPGSYVFLSVADTGCGMDEATRRRVCEPFFTTKETGNGMGMAAVLGIVRSHNGRIRLDSVPGKGSTFTVLFPAQTKPNPEREV
jgi:two-component system cell cycle sensor histidine kinase/response regulator CckA